MLNESWLDKLREPGAKQAELKVSERESWLDQLHRGVAEQATRDSDPWLRVLTPVLPADGTAISTVMIANLLGIGATTGNARRIAKTMRTLGFFLLKSRKLLPGGWRGNNGWAPSSGSSGPCQNGRNRCLARGRVRDAARPAGSGYWGTTPFRCDRRTGFTGRTRHSMRLLAALCLTPPHGQLAHGPITNCLVPQHYGRSRGTGFAISAIARQCPMQRVRGIERELRCRLTVY